MTRDDLVLPPDTHSQLRELTARAAPAISGERSDAQDVQDVHDRYANVESAYLPQRMESFDGLAILATNLDDAFTRRLHLVIDFPAPDPEQRLLL